MHRPKPNLNLQTQASPWLRSGVCTALGLVMMLMGQTGSANPNGQCLDIGALLGPTEQGHLQAEELVLQNHPSRDAVCVEMGWDCAGIASLMAGSEEEHPVSSLIPSEEIAVAPAVDDCLANAVQGRCLEEGDPALIPESTSEELFADDEPSPLSGMDSACFDFPSRCSALPPPDMPNTITVSTVPSTATNRAAPAILPSWGIDVLHHAHAGIGPSTGVSADIDHPPQAC